MEPRNCRLIIKNGYDPVFDLKIKAVSLVRKAVHLLSSTLQEEAFNIIISSLELGYYEFKKEKHKDKIIELFIYCQEEGMLSELFEKLILCFNFYNGECLEFIKSIDLILKDSKIEYLAFDISEKETCRARKISDEISSSETFHEISEISDDKNSCKIYCVCIICGEIVNIEYKHKWGNWNYKNQNSCVKIQECSNCHEKRDKIEHEWEFFRNSNGSSYNKCTHCHEEDEYDVVGLWCGYVNWNDGSRDYWKVKIEEKTRLLFMKSLIATMYLYLDIQKDKTFRNKVVLEAKVSIDKNIFNNNEYECIIKEKKIVSATCDYNKDKFEGKISKGCSSMVGIVSDGKKSGKLILK